MIYLVSNRMMNNLLEAPHIVHFEAECSNMIRASNSTRYNFSRVQKKYKGNEALVKIIQFETTGRFAIKVSKLHGTKKDVLLACINCNVPRPDISKTNNCAVHCYFVDHSAWKDLNRFFIIEFQETEAADGFVSLLNQIINLAPGEILNEEVPFQWFEIFDEINDIVDEEEDNDFHPSAFVDSNDDNDSDDSDDSSDDDDEEEEDEFVATQPYPEPPIYINL